jgi:hypothetical protein
MKTNHNNNKWQDDDDKVAMTSPLLDGWLVGTLVMLWLFAVGVSWFFGVDRLVGCG